jgi:hypothetical protein
MKTLFILLFGLIICQNASSQWLEGGRKQEQAVQGNGAILYHEGKLYTFNETMFISRSDDNGATWLDLPDSGLPPKGPGLAKNIKTLTAAGGRIYGGMNFGDGTGMPVYSTDNGETWNKDTLGAPGHALGWGGLPVVSDIFAWGHWLYVRWDAPNAFDIKAFDGPYVRNTFLATGGNNPFGRCAKGDTLFISSAKFFYSVDGGATWITPANNGYSLGTQLFVDGNRIYSVIAGTYTTPFRFLYTDDNGENWTTINVGEFGNHKQFGGMYYSPSAYFVKGNNIWVAVGQEKLDTPPNVFRSTDLGSTWVSDTVGLPKGYITGVTGFAYSNDGTLWCVPSYREIYKQKIDAGTGGGNSVTVAPTLLSPIDNANITHGNVTLSWGGVTNAIKYHLQVATDISFTTIVVDKNDITDTSYFLDQLANGTMYHWRVSGISNEGQPGPWAGMRSFNTMAQGVAEDAPVSINIYPNPAHDVLTISSNSTMLKSAEVFDMLGVKRAEVRSIGTDKLTVNVQTLPAGSYTVKIDAPDAPSMYHRIVIQ